LGQSIERIKELEFELASSCEILKDFEEIKNSNVIPTYAIIPAH